MEINPESRLIQEEEIEEEREAKIDRKGKKSRKKRRKKRREYEEENEGLKGLTTEFKHGLEIKQGNDYILCYKYPNTSLKPFFGQRDLLVEKTNSFVDFKNIHTRRIKGEEVKISFNVAVKKDEAYLFSNIFERKDPVNLFVKNIKTNKLENLGNFFIENYTYMLNADEYVKIDINFIKEDNYE